MQYATELRAGAETAAPRAPSVVSETKERSGRPTTETGRSHRPVAARRKPRGSRGTTSSLCWKPVHRSCIGLWLCRRTEWDLPWWEHKSWDRVVVVVVAGRVGGDFELCLERRKMGRHWVIKSGDWLVEASCWEEANQGKLGQRRGDDRGGYPQSSSFQTH